MTEDLYAILGVERTASKDEIKKAFRRKMKAAHPDREGGDTEEAARLNRAWDVLGDDEKRKRYDETGTVASSAGEPTLDDKAHQCLAAAFAQMLADEIELPAHEDPLERLIKAMKASLKQYEFELKVIDSCLKKLEQKQGRVKFTGTGPDVWNGVIEDRRKKYEANRLKYKEGIEVTERSLEIIKDYKGQFTPQVRPEQSMLDRMAADLQRQQSVRDDKMFWRDIFGSRD